MRKRLRMQRVNNRKLTSGHLQKEKNLNYILNIVILYNFNFYYNENETTK